MNRDKVIEQYLQNISSNFEVLGAFVCGSYVTGEYTDDSDLDTFILVKNHEFNMKLELYEEILFDRIIVDYATIVDILKSESAIGKILSYSFGSKARVLIESDKIDSILNISKDNISRYGLTYERNANKPKKIVDHIDFTIEKEENEYYLIKDNRRLV